MSAAAPARDLVAELDAWGEWPPAWKPQPGQHLVGRILRYSTGNSTYGPVRTCLLETDAGERYSLWLSSTVLLSLFRELKPRPGERIGVKFIGKHPERGYKRYALIVDRPETEPDFTPIGGEQQVDPDPEDANDPFTWEDAR